MALAVGQTFASYQVFKTKLKEFEDLNNVLFVKKSSKKLSPYHPELDRLQFEFVQFGCKQGKARNTESKGIRPNQRSYKVNCSAFVRVKTVEIAGQSCLKIVSANHVHENHPVDKKTASLYPENRRATVTDTVKVLVDTSVPNSHLRQFIKSTQNKDILPKDICNIQARLTQTDKTDSQTVQDVLKQITDDGGATKFGVNESGEFEFLFYVTERMKRDLCRFSDILVMDATYKVNQYLYPLINVLCIDDEGRGRPVLHGFVRNESSVNLLSCLNFLKCVMSDVSDPAVFFVDKDLSEIAAVRETFPSSLVKLCAFHASSAVKRALANQGLSSQQVDAFLDIFKEQRDTRSQERFRELCNSIRHDAPDKTVEYFQTNWWNIPDMWAQHATLDLQTLHITTTNHVECYHSKIKRTLHSQVNLSKCIKILLRYDQDLVHTHDINAHIHSNVRHYNVKHADTNLDSIRNSFTSFGSRIVSEQYLLAKKITYTHTLIPSSTTQSFQTTANTLHGYSYLTTVTDCNCDFFSKFHLSCRHMFSLRQHLGQPIYSPDMHISSRFHKTNRLYSDYDRSQGHGEFLTDIIPDQHVTNTQEGRYRIISSVTSGINRLFQVMGEGQFLQRLAQLEQFVSLVTEDKCLAVVDLSLGTETVTNQNETVTEAVTDQTETVTNQTETVTDQTEAVTDQTETVTNQTETVTDQTEAVTDQTETVTNQTETVTDQTEAVTDQIETVTNQTEAVTDQTETVTEAVTDQTEHDSDSDFDFSFVKLPAVKTRGRPSKRQAFTRRLTPSKKRRVACSVLRYLKMLVEENLAFSVFNSSVKIDSVSIRGIEDIDHSIITCDESLMRPYFTDDAWLIFLNIILTKRLRLSS